MLHIVEGNLFESRCSVLVNTVNCVGTMGKGLAAQFSWAYPEITPLYVRDCEVGRYRPGTVIPYTAKDGTVIACAATKGDWRYPSRYDWVAQCLKGIQYAARPGDTIALPPLGAGLGGLDGRLVLNMVRRHFDCDTQPFDVYYFLPR